MLKSIKIVLTYHLTLVITEFVFFKMLAIKNLFCTNFDIQVDISIQFCMGAINAIITMSKLNLNVEFSTKIYITMFGMSIYYCGGRHF